MPITQGSTSLTALLIACIILVASGSKLDSAESISSLSGDFLSDSEIAVLKVTEMGSNNADKAVDSRRLLHGWVIDERISRTLSNVGIRSLSHSLSQDQYSDSLGVASGFEPEFIFQFTINGESRVLLVSCSMCSSELYKGTQNEPARYYMTEETAAKLKALYFDVFASRIKAHIRNPKK